MSATQDVNPAPSIRPVSALWVMSSPSAAAHQRHIEARRDEFLEGLGAQRRTGCGPPVGAGFVDLVGDDLGPVRVDDFADGVDRPPPLGVPAHMDHEVHGGGDQQVRGLQGEPLG